MSTRPRPLRSPTPWPLCGQALPLFAALCLAGCPVGMDRPVIEADAAITDGRSRDGPQRDDSAAPDDGPLADGDAPADDGTAIPDGVVTQDGPEADDGPSADAAADGWPVLDAPQPEHTVGAGADDCANAYDITLSANPISVEIDTSLAADDFGTCPGTADVVLHLSGSTILRLVGCWGGGTFSLQLRGGGCESPTSLLSAGGSCHPALGSLYTISDPVDLVICRDPAQGPITLLLQGQ